MKIKLLVIYLAAISLSGCSIGRINKVIDNAKNDSDKVSEMIAESSPRSPVRFHNEQWINPVPIKSVTANIPPAMINCSITYKPARPQDVYQFSQDVTQQCNIPVRIAPDAATLLSGSNGGGGGENQTRQLSNVPAPIPTQVTNGMIPLQSLGSMPGANTGSYSGRSASSNSRITDVAFSGNVARLLDLVTARLGVSWKYENGSIVIFYLETKRFNLDPTNAKYALNNSQKSGLSTQTGTGSNNSSSGGLSGSSGSNTLQTTEMSNDLYGDIQKTVESMLTPEVGRVSLNQTSGVVVVTDVPEVVRSIGEYLKDENSKLSKQVLLKVVVYTITSEVSDNVGIDWNIIFKSLSGKYGINFTNSSGLGTDLANGGFEILDTATGKAAQFAGSQFLFQALSKQANVTDTKTLSLMTTNLATAGLLVGKQTTYLQRTSVTSLGTGTSSEPIQSLEPGQITTGTSIVIMPKVMPDNDRMMLTMMMDISSLNKLRKIENANKTESIEAPDTDSRSIPQRVWLKPGETIVMSGFEQIVQDGSKQGVGSPNNILLGGGMSGSSKKESFVITITPELR
ncbi:PilN family type IVB pilus formation outer membrane protein [Xenorhabdus bovienii]|uniref:PilN family type IVB pilus formation outer membrane protein n=1 Tax=Xenorhabdus bovienii TaxID=40576 RepID=UPI003DA2599A